MQIVKATDGGTVRTCGLIYASPGMGKTTAVALEGKKTLIIDIDRSSAVLRSPENMTNIPGLAEAVQNIDIVKINTNMSNFEMTLAELEAGAYKNYELIVVDCISELEHQMLTEYGKAGKNDGAPELVHYNRAGFKLIDYVRRLRALDVNVLFTAWEEMMEVIDVSGEKYHQARPKLGKSTAITVTGHCNLVAHLEVALDKDGKPARYYRTQATKTAFAKDQINGRVYAKIGELIK